MAEQRFADVDDQLFWLVAGFEGAELFGGLLSPLGKVVVHAGDVVGELRMLEDRGFDRSHVDRQIAVALAVFLEQRFA